MIIKENLDIIDSRIIDGKYFIVTDDNFFKNYVFNNLQDALSSYDSRNLINPLDANIIYR